MKFPGTGTFREIPPTPPPHPHRSPFSALSVRERIAHIESRFNHCDGATRSAAGPPGAVKRGPATRRPHGGLASHICRGWSKSPVRERLVCARARAFALLLRALVLQLSERARAPLCGDPGWPLQGVTGSSYVSWAVAQSCSDVRRRWRSCEPPSFLHVRTRGGARIAFWAVGSAVQARGNHAVASHTASSACGSSHWYASGCGARVRTPSRLLTCGGARRLAASVSLRVRCSAGAARVRAWLLGRSGDTGRRTAPYGAPWVVPLGASACCDVWRAACRDPAPRSNGNDFTSVLLFLAARTGEIC